MSVWNPITRKHISEKAFYDSLVGQTIVEVEREEQVSMVHRTEAFSLKLSNGRKVRFSSYCDSEEHRHHIDEQFAYTIEEFAESQKTP